MDYCISDRLIPFSKISLESENIPYRFHPNLSVYSPPLSLPSYLPFQYIKILFWTKLPPLSLLTNSAAGARQRKW
jgi:hypothetical protein